MSRRISTDEKLRNIINGPDDDENYEQVERAEKNAKNQLRRTSLYGGGARAKIPKVKVRKSVEASATISPFVTASTVAAAADQENSAVPPGAHSDQFRIVQFPTEKSFNDPDRVFYTTTSLTEGIRFINQPPWYYGTENKTKPSDTSAMMAAGRYGYRGAAAIEQFHTHPQLMPSRTKTPQTPAFLCNNDDYVNEYAPPIMATRFQSVNGLESPKLWPETTEFATGYPKKRSSTKPSYNRQTTTATVVKPPGNGPDNDELRRTTIPTPAAALTKVIDKVASEAELLKSFQQMEKEGNAKSLTQLEIEKMNETWNDRVANTANSTLKATMKRVVPPYEQHTLMDTTDRMRYSGTSAFIVHSQSTEEIRFRYNLASTTYSQPYQLRWKMLSQQFVGISSKLKRDQSMPQLVHDIGVRLRSAGVMAGTPNMIRRSEFIKTLSKVKMLEDAPAKDLSLMFSIFDVMKKNIMRYVQFLAAFSVFLNPTESALEKLAALYRMHETYGSDIAPLDMCHDILCTCCASDDDKYDIEHYFKTQFQVHAYRYSILHGGPRGGGGGGFDGGLDGTASSSPNGSVAGGGGDGSTGNGFAADGGGAAAASGGDFTTPAGSRMGSARKGILGQSGGGTASSSVTAGPIGHVYQDTVESLVRTQIPRSMTMSPSRVKLQSREAASRGGRRGGSSRGSRAMSPLTNRLSSTQPLPQTQGGGSPSNSVQMTGFGAMNLSVEVDNGATDEAAAGAAEDTDDLKVLAGLGGNRSGLSLPLPSTGNCAATSRAGTAAGPKRDAAVQPTYNIADSVMTLKVFLKVLTHCPELVNTFDTQLESLLIQAYGKDSRHSMQDNESGGADDENKDFSWIIANNKKSPKKQKERPNIYGKPGLVPCTVESIFQR